MRTRIRAAVVGMIAMAALAVGAPVQAQPGGEAAPLGSIENPVMLTATSGCGSSCDGKDPASYAVYVNGAVTTCSQDAVTKSVNSDGIYLELRYSAACRTAWTRVPSDFYYPTIKSYYTDGRLRTSYSGFAGAYYTPMVNDAGLLAQAWASSGGGTWWTGKY